MKMLSIISVVAIGLASTSVYANVDYVCGHGGAERKISIVYLEENSTLPCEVHYTKENDSKILWQATSELGYCESKAEEFVQKQEGWGWDCSKSEQQSQAVLVQ